MNFLHRCNIRRLLSIFTVLIATGVAGCVSSGKNFKSDTAWIVKNKTKQEDVKFVMGEPTAIGDSSGVATWTYGYYRYELFSDALAKELKFYWNPDRTVQSYSFTSSFPEDVAKQPGKAPPAQPKPESGRSPI